LEDGKPPTKNRTFCSKCRVKRQTLNLPASLRREKGEGGHEIVRCKVVLDDGYILGMANSDVEIATNLSDTCKMRLDYGLHGNAVGCSN